jgi:hypothetical protein
MLVSLFEQIIEALLAHDTARFLLIWMMVTAAICLAVTLALVGAPKSQVSTIRPTNLSLTWRQVGTPRALAGLTLMAVFLGSYIAMTLAWEDFAYFDNSMFTQITLKGHNIFLAINPDTGRFQPLAGQEFNLIRHFTGSANGYQLLPIFQLLVFFSILMILDAELSISARAALAILALLTPSILISFGGLIFDERDVLFFLVCLMLCVKKFEQSGLIAWAVAATVSAQTMLYYKETAFLLLLGFAVGRLILRRRKGHCDRLWDNESRLDLCLASLGVLFFVYYFALMGIHPNMNYALTQSQPRTQVVLGYIRVDLLAWLFVAVVLVRIYLILRHQVAPLPFWDGLALGGVTYFFAYLYLSMFRRYYLAPVDLIAILYVGRFVVLSWKNLLLWGKIAAIPMAFLVLLQNLVGSALVVFDRKNIIHGKAEIGSVVKTQYRSGAENHLRLFFPFASPYSIMEFGAYLDYRGIPVERAVREPGEKISVVLATRAVAEDGPCVEWMTIRCHRVYGSVPGDLVIVLPDDSGSAEEASVYRGRGELLLLVEPTPSVPHWLHSVFAMFRPWNIPDRWMDGSVTIWQ